MWGSIIYNPRVFDAGNYLGDITTDPADFLPDNIEYGALTILSTTTVVTFHAYPVNLAFVIHRHSTQITIAFIRMLR